MKKILTLAQFLFVLTVCGQKPFELNYRYAIGFVNNVALPSVSDSAMKFISNEEAETVKKFLIESNRNQSKAGGVFYESIGADEMYLVGSDNYLQLEITNDSIIYHPDFCSGGYDNEVSKRPAMDLNKAIAIEFFQEWFYDTQRNRIEVVVNGLSPIYKIYNTNGTIHGDLNLYWIKQYEPISFLKHNGAFADTSIVWANQIKCRIDLDSAAYHGVSRIHFVDGIKKIFDLDLAKFLFKQAENNLVTVYNPETEKRMTFIELEERLVCEHLIEICPADNQHSVNKKVLTRMTEFSLGPMLISQTFLFDTLTGLVSSRIDSIVITGSEPNRYNSRELFEVRFSN